MSSQGFVFDVSPWRRKLGRLAAAVREMPRISVVVKNTYESDAAKSLAAVARGDSLAISDEAIAECRTIVAEAVAEAAEDPTQRDLLVAANDIGEVLEEDARQGILDGRVEGPERSAEWEEEKGNTIKLLGKTGDLADALRYELKSR